MMRTFAAASMAAAFVSAEAAPGSAVQKVIQLLDELKAKVAADIDGEKSQMAEYSTWCDDTITQAGFDIETATKQIEALGAVIEENTGIIAEMEATLQEKGSETASAQGDLKAATEIRAKESEEFVAAEKELVEAVDMLARAHSILEREMHSVNMGLLQGDAKAKVLAKNQDVVNAVKALSAIVNAAWMDPKAAKKVKSFLAVAADDDDDLSLVQQKAKQPAQSAKYSYEGHSDAILETIDDMKDKAEEELGELRKAEMNTKHNFEMLKQSLTDSITNLNKEVDVAQKRLGEAGEAKGKAEGEKASTESSKAADVELKATTQSNCDAKASEWDARQKSAADEITALGKAREILSSGVKAMFIQTVTSSNVKAVSHVKNDSRSQLVRLLKKMGRQYNSFGLMQIANKAKSDPFVKVRGLVEDMIAKLEKEAQEEATHDAFCKEETSKSTTKRDELSNKADMYQARMDKTTAAIAGLSNEVAELSKDLSDMQKSMAEATSLRASENSSYKKASTDYKESAEAVAKAVSVLREFYGSAALLQMGQPEFGSSKSDSGNSIIAFLETAEQDFSRLLAEEETSESESLAAYNKYMQESKVTVAKKTAEKAGKESEIKSLKVALGNHKEDYSSTNKELDAVMEYLEKLKEQCTSKAHTYEERKAKREAEMEGLKQALDILSGDAPAFVQTSKKFLARK